MKRLIVFLVLAATVLSGTAQTHSQLGGAWEYHDGNVKHLIVFVDGYFSHTRYDLQGKQFIGTRGGTYSTDGNTTTVIWQYDTDNAPGTATELGDWLGQSQQFTTSLRAAGLQTDVSGSIQTWQRIDQNEGPLAGVWRISGRKQDDQIRTMPLRDRRTLKILTGTRFQWVAINIATGEFSGTGGGTYTFKDGKYTENIEFFSRDNSRVGASLVFDGKVENGDWHHSGLSSAGNPIYEIWERLQD